MLDRDGEARGLELARGENSERTELAGRDTCADHECETLETQRGRHALRCGSENHVAAAVCHD